MIFSLEILYIFKGFFLSVSFSSNFNCWNIWTSVIRQHALCSDCIHRHYPVNGNETVCSTLWDKTMVVNESFLLFLRLHILDSTPHLLTSSPWMWVPPEIWVEARKEGERCRGDERLTKWDAVTSEPNLKRCQLKVPCGTAVYDLRPQTSINRVHDKLYN